MKIVFKNYFQYFEDVLSKRERDQILEWRKAIMTRIQFLVFETYNKI